MTSWTGKVNNREVTYDCVHNPTQNNPNEYIFKVVFWDDEKPVIEMYEQTEVTDRVANNMEKNWKCKLYSGNIIDDFISGGLQNIKSFTQSSLLRWTTHDKYKLEYKITIHYEDFTVCFEKTSNKATHYNNKSYTYGCWYTEVICQKNNGNYKIIMDEPNNSFNSVFYGLSNKTVFQTIISSFLDYEFEIQFQLNSGNSYQNVVNYNGVNKNYEIQYAHTNSVLDIPKDKYKSNKMNEISYLDLIGFFNGNSDYPKISGNVGGLVARNSVFGTQNKQLQTVHIQIKNVYANGEVDI